MNRKSFRGRGATTKSQLVISIAVILIAAFSSPDNSIAQCPGFSWITELHAKNKSINCQSAAREISSVFSTIISALKSGRTVEIKNFGEFSEHSSKKKSAVSTLANTRRIYFKSDPNLFDELNENKSLPNQSRKSK